MERPPLLMSDWNIDPDEKPDSAIRAEAIILGIFVGFAYIYGAYLVARQLDFH